MGSYYVWEEGAIDFSLARISRDKINVSYIIKLLLELQGKSPEEQTKIRKTIMDVLDTEAQLRSKKELIQRFISDHFANMSPEYNVSQEFYAYWEAEKEKALESLSAEEALIRDEPDLVARNYLFSEKTSMRDDVISIMVERPSLRERRTAPIG